MIGPVLESVGGIVHGLVIELDEFLDRAFYALECVVNIAEIPVEVSLLFRIDDRLRPALEALAGCVKTFAASAKGGWVLNDLSFEIESISDPALR